jgi:hypothetical protein
MYSRIVVQLTGQADAARPDVFPFGWYYGVRICRPLADTERD